jgi:hypothetical protein
MPELIHQYTHQLIGENGATYTAFAYGRARADGTWEGWIEFHPLDGDKCVLRTDRETTQSDRAALAYWASGLEPIYFEGALARARSIGNNREPGAHLA